MNVLARRQLESECEGHATSLNGERIVCDPSGGLFLPDHDLLVVADLHLEKSAAFARRGSMLPPYDTLATLTLLETVLDRYRPSTVLCLGDSFHDRRGASLMPALCFEYLAQLIAGRDWIWITGNHDPEPLPPHFGGRSLAEATVGALTFRHEPQPAPSVGEVAGHLHPVAQVFGAGRSRRAACFVSDGDRMVAPAFGALTGGLDIMHEAFAGLFQLECTTAYVIGTTRIYPIGLPALVHSRRTRRRG